jgi:ADP-ribose pyrophosphatase YjhB (NUDIX family)
MASTPQAASSAILERDGRFLLIRRINPPMANLYAFPGGRAEPGEAADQTAVREFLEETGIAVRNPVLFATYDLKSERQGGPHFTLSVFKVEADTYAEAVAADDAADAGWYTVEEIRCLPVPPSVRDCAERLAAEIADR